jgi:pre-mycofactocin synthase
MDVPVPAGGIPNLKVPNLATEAKGPPTFAQAYVEWLQTPLPTWDDVRWLRERCDGPFVVKGVLHPDDARRSIDAGATAISVSNHGGNNLDGTPASLRVLPSIVDAVGEPTEVLFDGGVRRGSDVVKALAFGARAVLVGRAWLWGLAAGGARRSRGSRHPPERHRRGPDRARPRFDPRPEPCRPHCPGRVRDRRLEPRRRCLRSTEHCRDSALIACLNAMRDPE